MSGLLQKLNDNPKLKVAKEAAIKRADVYVSNVAGSAISGLVSLLNPKKDGTQETYSRVKERFANIHSSRDLKKEMQYLKEVLRDCTPKTTQLINELKSLREKVAKRLASDAQVTGTQANTSATNNTKM